MRLLRVANVGMSVVAFITCLLSAQCWAGSANLYELDQNMYRKTDLWIWKVDDRITTSVADIDGDGKPDRCMIWGELGGRHRIVTSWENLNSHGEFQTLVLRNADGSTERWDKQNSGTPNFDYWKWDYVGRVFTRARTSEFGNRVLDLKPAQIFARSKRKRLKCPEMLARVDVARKQFCRQGGHFR